MWRVGDVFSGNVLLEVEQWLISCCVIAFVEFARVGRFLGSFVHIEIDFWHLLLSYLLLLGLVLL